MPEPLAEPAPLKHHEVVGYIVLVWQPGMGWQDNWDGEVHATYEDALRSADEYDGEDIIVTEARYVATADPANWHAAAVGGSTDPAELCALCGVRADRAVHDRAMAAQHGVIF